MNAHDRRIIHLALQEDEALITKSRGEGEYRKIVILPARGSNNNSKARGRE
jgi:spoIIIJ-associated protein